MLIEVNQQDTFKILSMVKWLLLLTLCYILLIYVYHVNNYLLFLVVRMVRI